MSMNVGGGGGIKSEINVTPLVDVVLVLLIIFMVMTRAAAAPPLPLHPCAGPYPYFRTHCLGGGC